MMDHTLLPLSEDRYGSFSSAEQAECATMRSRFHESELDILSTFDFDSFIASSQVEHSNGLECNEASPGTNPFNFSLPMIDQNEGFSSVSSTPSSTSRDLDTPAMTPDGLHLVLPMENISFSPHVEHHSAFDLTSLSGMAISSPGSQNKDDFAFLGSGANALGLMGGTALNEGALASTEFLSSVSGQAMGTCGQNLAFSGLPSNDVVSPVSDLGMLPTDGHGLHLPFEQRDEPGYLLSLPSHVDRAINDESGGPLANSTSSPTTVTSLENVVSASPPSTQEIELQVVQYPTCNKKGRSTRAATAKARSPRVHGGTRRSATRARPTGSSNTASCGQQTAISSVRSADRCEHGWRVWAVEGGHRVAKWKCSSCGQLVGRRPDLNRHYKTCVVKDKYFCLDIIHADGSIWPGCGQEFSRRDACHRHLRRRLTHGRCVTKLPQAKEERSKDEHAFIKKMICYEDGLLNHKWRAALPAFEKNRLVKTALAHVKQDMF